MQYEYFYDSFIYVSVCLVCLSQSFQFQSVCIFRSEVWGSSRPYEYCFWYIQPSHVFWIERVVHLCLFRVIIARYVLITVNYFLIFVALLCSILFLLISSNMVWWFSFALCLSSFHFIFCVYLLPDLQFMVTVSFIYMIYFELIVTYVWMHSESST